MSDWKQNLQKTRYAMDGLLLLGFMLVSAPQSTGVPLHEWFSLIFAIPFVIHILLHWDWIKSSYRRMSSGASKKEKFSIVWAYILYLVMLLVFVSGFLVSVSLLPAFNIDLHIQDFWSKIHHDSATLIMPVIGIHLALYWNWIVKLTKRMTAKSA
ncbi:cytochrome b/b6 domain-containing protein [Vibrio sp. F74]|uniref:cytochrome b/b6 domain-containing protein n=1 Tax=Vibrio sp. F74 TaxID=700020 RepID=UPI0035F546AD